MLRIKLNRIPEASFLVFFTGFFLYHSLVGLGIISPIDILSGYSGVVGIALFPILAFIYLLRISRQKIKFGQMDRIFFALMAYFLLVALVHNAFGRGLRYEAEMWKASLTALMYNVLLYFIGRLCNFADKSFEKLLAISLVLMTGITVGNMNSFGVFNPAAISDGVDNVASYQGLARSLVITSILCVALSKNKTRFALLSVCAAVGLAALGSRAEFTGFLGVTVILAILKYKVRGLALFVISVIGLLSLVLAFLPDVFFENSRIFGIFDVFQSESGIARSELTQDAITSIENNFLLGDYGSYVMRLGVGFYSHNILSAWVDLGLIGFLGYLFLFVSMGIVLWRRRGRDTQRGQMYWVASSIYIFTLVLMITSKDYTFMFFGFSVGLVAGILNTVNNPNRDVV